MDKYEFKTKIQALFSDNGLTVHNIDVFENKHGLQAWVVVETEESLNLAVGESLLDAGYTVLNHSDGVQYLEDNAEHNAYLIGYE